MIGYERARKLRHGVKIAEPQRFWDGNLGELELQARFYNGLLGLEWAGADGEDIEAVHLGRWNREAGPDFCGARLKFDGEELTGDIEIDMDAADWDRHGHSRNPAYDRVILHVFTRQPAKRHFTRNSHNGLVRQLFIPLENGTVRTPAKIARDPLSREETAALVEAAAKFRLHRKQEAFVRLADLRGAEEAVFLGLAEGMGYKSNKLPFLLTAQRTAWERARKTNGEAHLFGIAGFLRAKDFDDSTETEAREYLRNMWDVWWEQRNLEERLILPADAWKFSGIRPANHPHRRMGALAALAPIVPRLVKAIHDAAADDFVRLIESRSHDFWNTHANLSRHELPRRIALIGADRAGDLLINVFLPAVAPEKAWRIYPGIAAPAPSAKVGQTGDWLCDSVDPALLKSAAGQQGLLQLHTDFFGESPRNVWNLVMAGRP